MRLPESNVVLAVMGVAIIGCGQVPEEVDPQQQAVINGRYCDERGHPSAMAIMIDAKMLIAGQTLPIRSVMCTATLIAPDVALTAAHCVDSVLLTQGAPGGSIKDEKYYVSFKADLADYADPARQFPGATLLPIPDEALPVKAFVRQETFKREKLTDGTFKGGVNDSLNDIALMFLEKPVTDVQPGILITKEEASQIKTGNGVQIVGWGQQTPAPMFPPPPKGSVGLKYCGSAEINEVGESEMQIGAGVTTPRKCHGDSGGPSYMEVQTDAVQKMRVVGVTSHAYDGSDCAKGGVDTRVDSWLDWLDATMKAACADKTRVWCEVEGIIPPEYYDKPVTTADAGSDDGGINGDGGATTKRNSGCSVSSTIECSTFLWLLVGLALLGYRRRVR